MQSIFNKYRCIEAVNQPIEKLVINGIRHEKIPVKYYPAGVGITPVKLESPRPVEATLLLKNKGKSSEAPRGYASGRDVNAVTIFGSKIWSGNLKLALIIDGRIIKIRLHLN